VYYKKYKSKSIGIGNDKPLILHSFMRYWHWYCEVAEFGDYMLVAAFL